MLFCWKSFLLYINEYKIQYRIRQDRISESMVILMNSWISDGRISPPNLRSYGLYVEKESVNSNFFLLNSMLFKRAYRYCKKPAIRFSSRIFSLSLVARQKIVLINDPVKLTWSPRSRLLPSSFEKNNKSSTPPLKIKRQKV